MNSKMQCILPTPNGKVASLCFGGPDFDILYAMCGDKVYQRKLKVKGANAWGPPLKPAAPPALIITSPTRPTGFYFTQGDFALLCHCDR